MLPLVRAVVVAMLVVSAMVVKQAVDSLGWIAPRPVRIESREINREAQVLTENPQLRREEDIPVREEQIEYQQKQSFSLKDPQQLPESCLALPDKFVDFLKGYLSTQHPTSFVYNCEPNLRRFCGGTGDRYRGIITTLFLAMLSGKNYKIHSPYPAPFTCFFNPTYIDWTITEEEVNDLTTQVDSSLMKLQKHGKFMKKLAKHDSQNIRAQSNTFDAHPYIWGEGKLKSKLIDIGMQHCNMSCHYSCLYDLLFEPNKEATDMIAHTVSDKVPFIAMQVRVSGPWAEGLQIGEKWRTHPEAFPYFWNVLDKLFSQDRFKTAKLFITTDAPKFLKLVEERYPERAFSTPGDQFNHTDLSELHNLKPEKYKVFDSNTVKKQKFQLTLLNNYVLGMGDYLVMAQSGFGDTAFWRTKKEATCLFVNIDTYKKLWIHQLRYPSSMESVKKIDNSIINIKPP